MRHPADTGQFLVQNNPLIIIGPRSSNTFVDIVSFFRAHSGLGRSRSVKEGHGTQARPPSPVSASSPRGATPDRFLHRRAKSLKESKRSAARKADPLSEALLSLDLSKGCGQGSPSPNSALARTMRWLQKQPLEEASSLQSSTGSLNREELPNIGTDFCEANVEIVGHEENESRNTKAAIAGQATRATDFSTQVTTDASAATTSITAPTESQQLAEKDVPTTRPVRIQQAGSREASHASALLRRRLARRGRQLSTSPPSPLPNSPPLPFGCSPPHKSPVNNATSTEYSE